MQHESGVWHMEDDGFKNSILPTALGLYGMHVILEQNHLPWYTLEDPISFSPRTYSLDVLA